MTAKLVIILSVIIASSVIANVYLYQKSASLQNIVSQLQIKNKELDDSLTNAIRNQTLPTMTTGGSAPSSTISGITSPSTLQKQSTDTNNYHYSYNNRDGKVNSTSQSITAVAVKAIPITSGFFESVRYQGTVMDITVDMRDAGKGLVLVNTEVPTGVDFQTSARTAEKVAQAVTGADLSDKDIIFSIKSKGNKNGTSNDLQAVDGPSAGAAMTVLLISELQDHGANSNTDNNNTAGLKQDVVMTGTINPDGTIGPVGGVPEKSLAAGQYGAKIFLVPQGQAVYTEQTCQKRQEGLIVYQTCQSEQKPLSDYTEKTYNMKVIEVKNVQDALPYFESK